MESAMNEKTRIDSLLQNGRITKEDHQILLAALDEKPPFLKRIMTDALNPFQKLSVKTSLLIGGFAVLAMSLIGTNLGLHFRGALDFQIIADGKRTFSFIELLVQNAIDVFCVSLIFYLGAFICKAKNLRFIDFISSAVFSRLPYAVFAILLLVLSPLFPGLLPRKEEALNVTSSLALALMGFTFLAWKIVLLFSALKESSGLKGKFLWLTFVLGLILAEVVSYTLNNAILK